MKIFFVPLIFIMQCVCSFAQSVTINQYNTAIAFDWTGTYSGVLPCADCPGIEISITLKKDGSYISATTYLGKNFDPYIEKGSFSWNDGRNEITLEGIRNGMIRYVVGENTLTQLDKEGKRITGILAEKYVLRKISDAITDGRWKLTVLMGKKIQDSTGKQQEIYIILNSVDKSAHGFAGCNNFSGSFEVSPGNRIMFSKMISTLRACPAIEVESHFLKILQTVDNYTVNENVLQLNKAKMAPLAVFEMIK